MYNKHSLGKTCFEQWKAKIKCGHQTNRDKRQTNEEAYYIMFQNLEGFCILFFIT